MKDKPGLFLQRTFSAVIFLCPMLFFWGCASPKAVVKAPDGIEKYRKIYFAIPEQDPRNVFPRVLAKLKQCEFDVIEVRADGQGFGSQGTGFVISPQGHLLTCAHVVHGTNVATVWVNGTRLPAKVVATDTNLDLALLQVSADKALKHLSFVQDAGYRMGAGGFYDGLPAGGSSGIVAALEQGAGQFNGWHRGRPKADSDLG